MKRSIKFVLPFVLAASLFVICSCNNAEEKKAVERCDQIAMSLDSAGKKLKEANEDSLKKKYLQFRGTSGQIERHFNEIKTEENFNDLCRYRECKKPLKNLVMNYRLFKKEIDTAAAQVDRLKHDIKADLLTKDEINQYLALEETNAKEMLKKVNKSVDDALSYEKRFDTLHPRILRYIEQARPAKK